jgi:hypothetical protein
VTATAVFDPFKATGAQPVNGNGSSHSQETPEPAPLLTMADVPEPADGPPSLPPPAFCWTITPDMSRELMALHDHVVEQHNLSGKRRDGHNRTIRWGDVDTYARDMKAGNWQGRNGQTVKIAYDHTCPDGQHRFMACIKADRPFETYVVFGVPPEFQDTMDTGIPRKIHDQLNLRGEPNAKNLSTISTWAWKWLRGARSRGGYGVPKPSELELIEFIGSDDRLKAATTWAVRSYGEFRPVRVSVYGMAWLLLHGLDHFAAEVFLEGVTTGADLSAGHPALTFRNRMIRARTEKERLNEHEQLALLCVAWNAFREERSASILKLPAGGLTPKNFPDPK